jgi:hypothetical protein
MDAVGADLERCDNCRIEISGEAVERDAKPYCCDGCADDGPCTC